MKCFKALVSFAIAINMMLAPALTNAQLTEQDRTQLSQYRAYLEPMGYELSIKKVPYAILYDNLTNQPVQEISYSSNQQLSEYNEYARSKNYRIALNEELTVLVTDKNTRQVTMEIPFSKPNELRKFTPSSMNKLLMDEMIRVKQSSKAAWAHTVKTMPTEALVFFVAMGAVAATQLITDYAQNPISLRQHLEHQTSPLGAFGFFTFMYTQGFTSNMLAMYMKNPKYQHMIPYLGMVAGGFVQTYLTQFLADPNVLACAKSIISKSENSDLSSCDKAFEYLLLHKKIWEFAPGLTSMLISGVVSAKAQAVVTKSVLRVTGVDIGLWLTPGAMQLKGLRWFLVKGLQAYAFVALDALFIRHVTYIWRNIFDASDFHSMNTRLVEGINGLTTQKDSKAVLEELELFKRKMADWRMVNLADVYEAHQNWSANLQQLTSMYGTTYSFYNAFINEVRNSVYNQSGPKLLEMYYPLNGVIAKDFDPSKEEAYFTSPKLMEHAQSETVADIAAAIKPDLNKHFFPREKEQFKKIQNLLSSEDREEQGRGLLELNREIQFTRGNTTASSYYRQALQDIYQRLGAPEPLFESGRGFLYTYENHSKNSQDLKVTGYYNTVGIFHTPKVTDYLLMQMICGPDVEAGQSPVKSSKGFQAVFLAPQIRNSIDDFGRECDIGRAQAPSQNIYTWPVKDSSGKSHKGFVSYLLKNTRNSVIGSEETSGFEAWWQSTTEKQMETAFADFSKKYDEIVVKLVRSVNRLDRFPGNRGPIANGLMHALFQEERAYLAILQHLATPQKSFELSFERTLFESPLQRSTGPSNLNSAILNIEKQFAGLNYLFQKIKIVKINGEERIESDVFNSDFQKQLKNIQAALENVATLLGVNKSELPMSHRALQKSRLNTAQAQVAITVLEALQSLATEMMMYGSIANAVSWDKIRDLKVKTKETQEFNKIIEEKQKNIWPNGSPRSLIRGQ